MLASFLSSSSGSPRFVMRHDSFGRQTGAFMRMLIGGIVAALAVAGCVNDGSSGGVPMGIPDLEADRVMIPATTMLTRAGVRRAVMRSDSMHVFEDSSVAHAFDVSIVLNDTLGNENAAVTSDRGRYELKTQEVTVYGSVVVILRDGTRVESERLYYDPGTGAIWSDVETRRLWPDGSATIFGTFETNETFSRFGGTNMRGRAPKLEF